MLKKHIKFYPKLLFPPVLFGFFFHKYTYLSVKNNWNLNISKIITFLLSHIPLEIHRNENTFHRMGFIMWIWHHLSIQKCLGLLTQNFVCKQNPCTYSLDRGCVSNQKNYTFLISSNHSFDSKTVMTIMILSKKWWKHTLDRL